MSFNTWWKENSKKLGVVSLGYDLDRCWRASRAEAKANFKRKVLKELKGFEGEYVCDVSRDGDACNQKIHSEGLQNRIDKFDGFIYSCNATDINLSKPVTQSATKSS